MGVVLPYHHFRSDLESVEVPGQRGQRAGHMAVPEIPRLGPAAVHHPVVLLGVVDQVGVLLGEEQLVLGRPAVQGQQGRCPLAEVHQLGHHLVLAGDRQIQRHRVAVLRPLAPYVVEAAVAGPGLVGGVGVHRVEVGDDGVHGRNAMSVVQRVGVPEGLLTVPTPESLLAGAARYRASAL